MTDVLLAPVRPTTTIRDGWSAPVSNVVNASITLTKVTTTATIPTIGVVGGADAAVLLPTVHATSTIYTPITRVNISITLIRVLSAASVPAPTTTAIQNPSITLTTVVSSVLVPTPAVLAGADQHLTLDLVQVAVAVHTPAVHTIITSVYEQDTVMVGGLEPDSRVLTSRPG